MDQAEHLQVFRLSESAKEALIRAVPELHDLLLGGEPYQVNTNISRLESACQPFIKLFNEEVHA